RETALLPLITFALVAVLSMLFFNIRLVGLLGPLLVVLASIAMTVGFIALMDWKLGLLFLMVPTLLTAIGVAQSVHLLAEFQQAAPRALAAAAAARRRPRAPAGWRAPPARRRGPPAGRPPRAPPPPPPPAHAAPGPPPLPPPPPAPPGGPDSPDPSQGARGST